MPMAEGRMGLRVGLLAVLVLVMGMAGVHGRGDGDVIRGAVHIITNTECKKYFSFQSLALLHSIKKVGQPGNFTRLVSCSQENLEKFSREDLETIPSHVAPQAFHNLKTGDRYLPYNKPMSIMHWLEHAKPKEEWILVVDPDMYFRHPVLPDKLQIQEGWMMAMHYNYLSGVANELADAHVPEVEKKSDSYGGPVGRRADQIGCYYLIRRKDLERVAPLWYKYTEAVREDPEAWRYAGDNVVGKGKPWIAEMYGMIFGMAHIGLKAVTDSTLQTYPNYAVYDIPHLVHYGLKNKVLDYEFDKHEYSDFDAFQCPPSNQCNETEQAKCGLFPHPPYPHKVPRTPGNKRNRYGNLLAIEAVNTINQALCERHKQKCEESRELLRECGVVDAIAAELVTEFEAYDAYICQDFAGSNCSKKAKAGECITNWMEMNSACRQACGFCSRCSFRTTYDQSIYRRRAAYGSTYSWFKKFSGPEALGPFLEQKQLRLICLHVGESAEKRNPKCELFHPKKTHLAENGALVCSGAEEWAAQVYEENPSLWPSITMFLILGVIFVLWRNHRKKLSSKGRYLQ